MVVFAEDVGDTVEARFADSDTKTDFAVQGPFAAALRGSNATANLVVQAREAIVPDGASPYPHLTLTKRLPVAAGLGGGSADAAATLRALNELLRLHRTPDKLAAIGIGLGADVPMCLASLPLIAKGIGEQLAPVAGMPALPLVLACPPTAVRTADVFAALSAPHEVGLPPMPAFTNPEEVASWLKQTRNDLNDAAAKVSPASVAAVNSLAADPECRFARMSGSGPAAFGIFSTRTAAEEAAARIATAEPTWWVTAATAGS